MKGREHKVLVLRVPPGATLHRLEIIADKIHKVEGLWFMACIDGPEDAIEDTKSDVTESIKDILEGWKGEERDNDGQS